MRWLAASVDCVVIEPKFDRALGRESFGPGLSFDVEPNHTLPLDRAAVIEALRRDFDSTSEGAFDGTTRACDAILIEAEGLEAQVLFYRAGAFEDVAANLAEENAVAPTFARELALVPGGADRLALTVGEGHTLETRPYLPRLAHAACPDAPTEPAVPFAWSTVELTEPGVFVADVDHGPDGCTTLAIAHATLDGVLEPFDRATFCVPPWAVPFEPGDGVWLEPGTDGQRLYRMVEGAVVSETVLFDQGIPPGGTHAYVDTLGLMLEPIECDDFRDRCGAYGTSGWVKVEGRGLAVAPGASVVVEEGGGQRRTLAIGTAISQEVSRAECGSVEHHINGALFIEYLEEDL
jgi:hypothetical protein